MKNQEVEPTLADERTQDTENHEETNPVPVLTNEWNVTPDGLGINTGKAVFLSDHASGIVQYYNSTRTKSTDEFDKTTTDKFNGKTAKEWFELYEELRQDYGHAIAELEAQDVAGNLQR